MRAKTILLGAVVATGLFLTGCGNGAADRSSSGGTRADNKAAAPAQAQGGAQAQADTARVPAQDKPAQAPDLRADQRSIIYRGSLSVRVKDVDVAAGEAAGIARTAGGFIGSDQRSTGGNGKGTATIELRVPAARFTAVVDQFGKLGDEQQRQISTEDVTEQTVDLDARITVQQARVDSGRRLLAQAKSLEDLVMLEKEVATRESDLASLQAKKRKLADLTALSTITVTMFEQDPPPPPVKKDDGGFLSGLAAGWHALLASLRVLLTVLGALLPWLIGFGVPVYFLVRLYKRYVAPRRAGGRLAVAGVPGLAAWRVPVPPAAKPGSEAGERAADKPDKPGPGEPEAGRQDGEG